MGCQKRNKKIWKEDRSLPWSRPKSNDPVRFRSRNLLKIASAVPVVRFKEWRVF
jgi:hypothetical protein